ncbi:MAG TPA: TetR/AcrR family transcriptional regulator [Rhodocyclaceae bacterium]
MAVRKEVSSLDPQRWIDAAIEILVGGNVDAIRVEVLAKTLGVTKGSFYWHFRDRSDLLARLLAFWRDGRIADITRHAASPPGREREQALRLIELYSANRSRKGIAIELAIRDWARKDEMAAKAVEEVDVVRLDLAGSLLAASGFPPAEARARSLLLYAYVFGQSLMFYDHFDDDLPALKRWVADHIVNR